MHHSQNRATLGGKLSAVLVAAGSSVGLGNIWRFPTEAGNNGGGAFLLVYILCVVLMGVPLMVAEFAVGRHSRANTGSAFRILSKRRSWGLLGKMEVLAAFLILAYYSVVAGWTLYYAFQSLLNRFNVMARQGDSSVFADNFNSFVSDPWLPLLCLAAFLFATHFVVVRGVKSGIERSSKILMPFLFLLMVVLVVCALTTPGAAKGLEFRNVFVVGMEENLFPSAMTVDSPRALEEERRLFYVAITRAEEHCFLSYAKTRMRYGKTEFGSPSRFLHDIDARYLSLPQNALLGRRVDEGAERFRRSSDDLFRSASRPQYGTSASSPAGERKFSREPLIASTMPRKLKRVEAATSAAPAPSGGGGLQAGQLIEHERFGRGEVLRVEGAGDNAKATIRFEHAGEKQLLLRFARFKVIG